MDVLTKNSIIDISQDRRNFTPVLQIIHIQPMTKKGSDVERFIIILSDGQYHMEGICTNNLGLAIKNGKIKNFAIIRLSEFTVNKAKNGKTVIIALNGEQVKPNTGYEIGSSVSYSEYKGANLPPKANSPSSSNYANTNAVKTTNSYTNRTPQKQPYSNKFTPDKVQNNGIKKMRSDEGAINTSEVNIIPVISLNPYRSKWAIKVRCTNKSEVRTWQKPTGSGKVLSVDLLDEDGTEIRASMFNETVERFENLFIVDNVYMISKARVKIANKKYTHIRNDYELVLDEDTLVEMARDDEKISRTNFSFTPIKDLEKADENSFVDILGVVSSVGPLTSIMSVKLNKYLDKRSLVLVDQTASIELTIWGETANDFNEETLKNNPVLTIKAARVSNFGGKSISISTSSKMTLNPDLQEVYRLKSWWEGDGKSAEITNLSGKSTGGNSAVSDQDPRYEVCDIKNKKLGFNGKLEFFVVKGTTLSMRHDFTKPPYYFACTRLRNGRSCNKKASQVGNNSSGEEFWCEACNSETEAKPRYVLGLSINDHTGSIYANCFDEVGEKVLGMSATELSKLCDGPLANESSFSDVFLKATFQTLLFKVRAMSETYLDEERVKCTVLGIEEVDYVKESIQLLEKLNTME